MESRTASSCPPMTLREREVLEAIQIRFLVPPLQNIFLATATQVLTKALLKAFINNLLTTLCRDSLLTEVPTSGSWGLECNDGGIMNLDSWDPRQTNSSVYKVVALPVMGDPATLTPIYPQWAILGGGSLLRTSSVKSIQLPSQEVFVIRESHLLVVVHCHVKVRISNRRTKIEEARYNVLIPADLKVVDLVKAFKVIGNASGIYKASDWSNDIRVTNTRTAMELGWRHGTELRLEFL